MSVTLFVIPLKRDKTEDYRTFIEECLGARKSEYKDLLLRYGCNTLQMWIHNLGGRNYAMFTHEMSENAAELLKEWPNSTHPFDKWFNSCLIDCYDTKDLANMPPQPVFIGELDARETKAA